MTGETSVPWSERASARWGHHAADLLCVAILGVVTVGLFPPPGLFAFVVPVLLMGFVVASWLVMRRHDRRLCEQCAASMPLNPSEKAVVYRRRFWLAHTGSEPRFLIPYLAVLIGSNFAQSTPGRIAWAFIQLSMIYLIVSNTTHRRLQPWCPWCSNGDGGGEKDDIAPPPPPVDHRQPV